MNQSDTIGALAGALAKAQGAMKNASYDAKNPQYNSKYATLASVIDAAREALSVNGLALVQCTAILDGNLYLETTLAHASGEWITSIYPVRPMRQRKGEGWEPAEDPQSIGSALSYARRYSISAILNIAEDDDDGNEATGKGKQATVKAEPPTQQPVTVKAPPTATPAPAQPAANNGHSDKRARLLGIIRSHSKDEQAAIKETIITVYGVPTIAEMSDKDVDDLLHDLTAQQPATPALLPDMPAHVDTVAQTDPAY